MVDRLSFGISKPSRAVSGHAMADLKLKFGAHIAMLGSAVDAVITLCEECGDHEVTHFELVYMLTYTLNCPA